MIRQLTATVFVATFMVACAETDTETPQSERTPAEGVFGVAPRATGGIPSVVTLTPVAPMQDEGGDGDEPRAIMDQFGLAFSPREMFAPVGQPVAFTNSEADLSHNVHVRSVDGTRDIFNDDATAGQTLDIEFSEEGGYDIACDMHPGMTAFVFATDAPYSVFADRDGDFRLPGVPEGEYTMRVWNADIERRSEQRVFVGAGATEVRIDTSR